MCNSMPLTLLINYFGVFKHVFLHFLRLQSFCYFKNVVKIVKIHVIVLIKLNQFWRIPVLKFVKNFQLSTKAASTLLPSLTVTIAVNSNCKQLLVSNIKTLSKQQFNIRAFLFLIIFLNLIIITKCKNSAVI